MSDVVTGEAVPLDLRAAKVASRGLALALDLAVQAAALLAGVLLLANASVDPALGAALPLALVVGVLLGYPVAAETLTRGRTLGKLALGLRVVRDDGGPIRFRQALTRGLAAVVEIYALSGTVALVVSLASAEGKRVGDFLAGTLVIRERLAVARPPAAAMPAGLAPWAASLELSALPDDLALAARQFLGRTRELAPDVRRELGVRLAADVAARVAPAPPAGLPPEVYLAAVLAERRRRSAARYEANQPRDVPEPAEPAAAPQPPPAQLPPFQLPS